MKKIIAILMFTAVLGAGIWAPPAQAALQARSQVLDATGRPLWYSDTNGLTLAHCIDANAFCLLAGVDPALSPETFYWLAEASLPAPLNGLLVLALESNPPAVPGGPATVFARIRIRVDAPVPGTYTVTHPFGQQTYVVPPAVPPAVFDGTRAINATLDAGLATPGNFDIALADDPLQAGIVNADGRSIGPFLTRADGTTVVDLVSGFTYINNPALGDTAITGSPFGTNFFRVVGPTAAESGETNLFTLVGKLAFCGPTNVAPVAVTDSVAQTIGQPSTINVLANDTDLGEGGVVGAINPATVVIVTPPTNGTAVANVDGTVTYTPNAGTAGADSFTYTVSDFCGLISAPGTVNILGGFARAEFRARTGKWSFKGKTSAASVGAVITIRRDNAAGPVIGTATVQADGSFAFTGKARVSPGGALKNAHLSSPAPSSLDLTVPFILR